MIQFPAAFTGATTDTPCAGCVGRGTGARCCMCGGPVPEGLRRTRDSAPEVDPGCAECRAGRIHAHTGNEHSAGVSPDPDDA